MEVSQEYVFQTFDAKVDFLADFVNGIAATEGQGLRKSKNKEFYLFKVFVKAHDKFGTINSQDAKAWVLAQGFSDTDFSRHRKALWRKNWLERKGKQYYISPLFFRNTGQVTFKISVDVSNGLDRADSQGARAH